jgi:hypothetical protein
LELNKILQKLFDFFVFGYHEVKIRKLSSFGPFHERKKNREKDVEVFNF